MMRIFNKILLLFCLLGATSSVYSQAYNTIHTGDWFAVSPGTSIYFIGDYTDSSSTLSVQNEGDMYFNGDVINNGTLNIYGSIAGDGRAHLIGVSSRIEGSNEIRFHNLEINKTNNTDTVKLNKFVIINDSLLLSNGDIQLNDSLELQFVGGAISSPGGIVTETNDNIITGPSFIKVTEIGWGTSLTLKTYETLKNVGISFEVKEYLGTSKPIIYRYNASQDCGGLGGSIERTFQFENIGIDGNIDAVSMKYLLPSELGLVPNGDSISIYFSNNDKDIWRDIGGNYATDSVYTSDVIKELNNSTHITAAKDSCDYDPFIQFNQVNLNVTPSDTLFGITNAQSCDGASVQIQVIGDPGVFTWTSPTGVLIASDSGMYHTLNEIGPYSILLEDRRGCIANKVLLVSTAPDANSDFSHVSPSLCDGAAFDFTPTTAIVGTYTYLWDLDNDGVFETNNYQITNHVFPSDGVNIVGLNVTTDLGCAVSSTEQIIIQPIPVAYFVPTNACPGIPISFDNNSTGNPNAGVDLFWDFDNDGSSDANTSGSGLGIGGDITYTFQTEGTYTVSLTASSNGCNSLAFDSIVTVLPEPVSDFTFTNACEGQPVQFTNASGISDFTGMTYSWDFNSPIGPNSTLENPSFTYPSTNNYNVSLTSTSINGCLHDTIIALDIDENPVADFTFIDACINTSISFADNSQIGVGTITNWNWNFDNTNTSILQNDIQTYAVAGNYNVELTVSTAQGCSATTIETLTVFDGPLASYSAIDQCVGTSVSFSNTSTNSVSYQWILPSLGQTSANTNPSFTFTSPGWHRAELVATSANNCVGTYIDSVEIFPLPNIGLGTTNTTCGTSYTLDASDNGNNAGASYFWNTGATTPQFTATYDGSFNVNVTSTNGCLSNESTTVTLNSAVIPNIADQNDCDLVTLDAGYPGSIYSWTGPSGFTSTSQTVDVTILGTSTYSVSVTDQNGCVGSASANVIISNSSPVVFGPDQIKCVGETVILDAGTPGSSYSWNTAAVSQTISVTQGGFYSVELINAAGCISGDTIQFTFNTSPNINLGADSAYCVSHQLNAFSANSAYVWNDFSVSPNLTITNGGQYFVEVTNTITNCVARDTIILVINDLPIVDLGNDTILCSYQSILIPSGNTGVSYNWNTGETTPDIVVSNTGSYSLEVTDINGCINTGQVNVTVNPIFTIDLGVDRPFCEGASVVLELDTVFVGAAYTWQDDTGVLANTATYSVIDTGAIYLNVINQNGCQAADSINILPSNLSLHAVFLADSKVVAGDTIIFIDLSYPKPYTLLWDLDNGFTSTDTSLLYKYVLPGDYDVSLTVNNGYCESVRTKTITVDPAKNISFEIYTPNLFSTIENVNLFPNPNNGDFNLKIKMTEEAAIQVEIFNLLGQQIFQEKFMGQEVTRNYSMKDLGTGIYIVRVMSGKDSQSLKFVKINN